MSDKKQVIAEEVLKQIIGRGVDWFDYRNHKDESFHRSYFNEANYISKSEIFNNEIKHYITDLMKFITYEAKDFDQVLHTRTAIITLETFKERLKSIENPNKTITVEDIHGAV